jgi:hypothetical protein
MKSPGKNLPDQTHFIPTPAMYVALTQLLNARDAADRLQRPRWDFAVEMHFLKEAGLDCNDVRSLICGGLVQHALERMRPKGKHRSFRRTPGLRLLPESCFILTDRGLILARQLSASAKTPGTNGGYLSAPNFWIVPFWDNTRRELRLGDLLVKRFRQPAKNQETILATFQEEGWPARIDDPLFGEDGQDAQERLHNTVKKLNRQAIQLIRFLSDGKGEGVLWESGSQPNPDRTMSGP